MGNLVSLPVAWIVSLYFFQVYRYVTLLSRHICWLCPALYSTQPESFSQLVVKVWLGDQQHQTHLEAY